MAPWFISYATSPIIVFDYYISIAIVNDITVEPLLWGHPDERPTPLKRPLDTGNLNINVLISTSDERPPLLKGHISAAKGVASQEGFHCIVIVCDVWISQLL